MPSCTISSRSVSTRAFSSGKRRSPATDDAGHQRQHADAGVWSHRPDRVPGLHQRGRVGVDPGGRVGDLAAAGRHPVGDGPTDAAQGDVQVLRGASRPCRGGGGTGRPRDGGDPRGSRRAGGAQVRSGGCAHGGGLGRPGDRRLHVAAAQDLIRRGGSEVGQVDAVVAGQAPHDRRDDLDRAWRRGVCCRRVCGRDGCGRVPVSCQPAGWAPARERSADAATPGPTGLGGAVPDEHGAGPGLLLLAVLRQGSGLVAGGVRRGAHRAGGVGRSGRPGGRDRQQWRPDGQQLARLAVQLVHPPGVRARQVHGGLGGLDRDDDLVDDDVVTDGDVPLHDLGLGQPLAEVGQQEHGGGHRGRHAHAAPPATKRRSGASSHCSRPMASSTRSTPGRCTCSSLGARVGDVQPADPQHRGVQGVEGALLHAGGDLCPDPAEALRLLDHHATDRYAAPTPRPSRRRTARSCAGRRPRRPIPRPWPPRPPRARRARSGRRPPA